MSEKKNTHLRNPTCGSRSFFADFIKTIKRSEFVFFAKVLEFCGLFYDI